MQEMWPVTRGQYGTPERFASMATAKIPKITASQLNNKCDDMLSPELLKKLGVKSLWSSST